MPKLIYPDSCPDCGHGLAISRRRGWIERLLARCLKIGVFRCHRCGARFYSPPAVIVHARTRMTGIARRKIDSEPVSEPVVIAPAAESAVAKVIVKMAPADAKMWPSSRDNWTQQAVRNAPSGTPWLWIRSSTSHRDDSR